MAMDLNLSIGFGDSICEVEWLESKKPTTLALYGDVGTSLIHLLATCPSVKKVNFVAVDMTSLYLGQLRMAAIKQLDYEEYLFFMGYTGGTIQGPALGDDRKILFNRLELPEKCKMFWYKTMNQWRSQGFVYQGRFENELAIRGKKSRKKLPIQEIWDGQYLEDQFHRFESEWPSLKVKIKAPFSSFKDKMRSTDKWVSTFHTEFISDSISKLSNKILFRKSWVLNMMFLGHFGYLESIPYEGSYSIWSKARQAEVEIDWHMDSVANHQRWADSEVLIVPNGMDEPVVFYEQLEKLVKVPSVFHRGLRSFIPPSAYSRVPFKSSRDRNPFFAQTVIEKQ